MSEIIDNDQAALAETAEADDHSRWFEELLNPDGVGVEIYCFNRQYRLDFRSDSSNNHFLTVYEADQNQVLIEADFSVSGQTMILSHNSIRENAADVFRDTPYAGHPDVRAHANAFDWYGHVTREDNPQLVHDTKNMLPLVLYLTGMIAREKSALRIEKIADRSSEYIYWHPQHLTYVQAGLNSAPGSAIGIFGSKSEGKILLARNTKINFIDYIAPAVAEVDAQGQPLAAELDWHFAEEPQPPVQSVSQHQKNITETAEKKALGGVKDSLNLPVFVSDTAGIIISGISHPDMLSGDSEGQITAKDIAPTVLSRLLPGGAMLVHCGQAIGVKGDINIPAFRMSQENIISANMAEFLREARRNGQIKVGSGFQEACIIFTANTPPDLLQQLSAEARGRSGLGIDYFPSGIAETRLDEYISVWVRPDGEHWVLSDLKQPEAKEIILGCSGKLFGQILRNDFFVGYPIKIHAQEK